MKDLQTILEFSKRSSLFTPEFFEDLKECSSYNSMGTFNWVINVLQIVKERIENEQKILYQPDKTKDEKIDLTIKVFEDLVQKYFVYYIVKSVFKSTILKHKVYFKLENTEEGMDLVYTGDEQNKLFKWIADLNDEQCLMRLLPTNVVYIRNNVSKTYTPFLTEHNSCYVYDEKDGKIKEYFG